MCAAALKESFCLTIPNQTRYLHLVTVLAKRLAIVVGMDDDAASKVSIAIDEVVTNIVSHADGNSTEHWVKIEFLFSSKCMEIQVIQTETGLREEDIALPNPSEYIKHPSKYIMIKRI